MYHEAGTSSMRGIWSFIRKNISFESPFGCLRGGFGAIVELRRGYDSTFGEAKIIYLERWGGKQPGDVSRGGHVVHARYG